MNIPKSFREVTVEQYQELLPIYKKIVDESDAEKVILGWVNIIAILADCQTDEVESLPIEKLDKIIRSLEWLVQGHFPAARRKYMFFKGRLYKATLNANEFNVARYVEIKTFLGRGGVVPELHNLLASIYTPLTLKGWVNDSTKHKERSELFKKAKVGKVYPTVFFYSKVWNNSIRDIQAYGIKKAEMNLKKADDILMQTLREILDDIGGGTAQSTK